VEARYTVTGARMRDIARLTAIERAAAALLRGHAPPAVLEETTSETELLEAKVEGRLRVALAADEPVGFALVEMLAPDLPHLEETDVHPLHGRRGVGTALVRAVCEWTRRCGHSALTLTTFRAVPWNMPFYTRLGFEEVSRASCGPSSFGCSRKKRFAALIRPPVTRWHT
jgi:GNAT superfamily N-acetyltransferase